MPRARFVRICPRCKSPYWDEPRIRIPKGGGGLGIAEILGPYRAEIETIARRYGASDIRVYGSVARGTATPSSDVDLLVDFDRSRPVRSTLRSLDFALELEKLLHRPVEVATEGSLHWYIQPQVVAEAVPL